MAAPCARRQAPSRLRNLQQAARRTPAGNGRAQWRGAPNPPANVGQPALMNEGIEALSNMTASNPNAIDRRSLHGFDDKDVMVR